MLKHLFYAMSCFLPASMALAEGPYPFRFSDYPVLTKEERTNLTREDLLGKSQRELDLLYSQLTAGSLLDGDYEGYVKFDESTDNDIERILALAFPSRLEKWAKSLGTSIWRGKTFNRAEGTLTNRMGPVQRYPARVFCGQSLLDSRRESIILDYAFGDTIPSYVGALDWPMTRKGLSIRDEIRMVKPGLYLGRAYIQNLYALNFILESEAEAERADWSEACYR